MHIQSVHSEFQSTMSFHALEWPFIVAGVSVLFRENREFTPTISVIYLWTGLNVRRGFVFSQFLFFLFFFCFLTHVIYSVYIDTMQFTWLLQQRDNNNKDSCSTIVFVYFRSHFFFLVGTTMNYRNFSRLQKHPNLSNSEWALKIDVYALVELFQFSQFCSIVEWNLFSLRFRKQ